MSFKGCCGLETSDYIQATCWPLVKEQNIMVHCGMSTARSPKSGLCFATAAAHQKESKQQFNLESRTSVSQLLVLNMSKGNSVTVFTGSRSKHVREGMLNKE
jgi:hypothetical protein